MTALIWRISSLSALVSAALAPLAAYLLGYPQLIALLVILAALIWFKHSTNISRILAGTESRIGSKKKD